MLIFYYLIPETPAQDLESADLKRLCHLNQSLTFLKQSRFKEALSEIEQALKLAPEEPKARYRKAQILLAMTEFEGAEEVLEGVEGEVEARLREEIGRKRREYGEKAKEMAYKMVGGAAITKEDTVIEASHEE